MFRANVEKNETYFMLRTFSPQVLHFPRQLNKMDAMSTALNSRIQQSVVASRKQRNKEKQEVPGRTNITDYLGIQERRIL
jgi:hypothetical protein